MGVTNFPNGVNVGSNAGGSADFELGGTIVTPSAAELNKLAGVAGAALAYTSAGKLVAAGTIIVTGSTAFKPAGLTTALFAVASVYGQPIVAGTAGSFANVSAEVAAGGTITIRAQDFSGTVSTQPGTASYVVVGT